jgi:hypothetical protein
LLTVLLIVSPDHQWDAASPQLRALRHAAIHHAPEAVREEVTSLRTQLEALVRYALPRVRFPEQQREATPQGERGRLTHPADTSRSSLASALALFSRWRPNPYEPIRTLPPGVRCSSDSYQANHCTRPLALALTRARGCGGYTQVWVHVWNRGRPQLPRSGVLSGLLHHHARRFLPSHAPPRRTTCRAASTCPRR